MAWFNDDKKTFVSNEKLVEVLGPNKIEDELEKRYLFRNIESVQFSSNGVIIKYKDLKVRTEMEVKMMREQLRKEAGLDVGLGR